MTSILIKSVGASHSGNYTCVAHNSFGSDKFTARLSVKCEFRYSFSPCSDDLRPYQLLRSGRPDRLDVVVRDGGEAVMRCEASGDPRPHVTWKRLSAALTDTHSSGPSSSLWTSLKTSDPSQLLLKNMRGEDSGVYACFASNGIGAEISAQFKVTVTGMTFRSFPEHLFAHSLKLPATRTRL